MKQPNIVITDYGVGNIDSIRNALTRLGYQKITLSSKAKALNDADAIILPGVGAFAECVEKIKRRNLDHILEEAVLGQKRPLMGICVGMQLMGSYSEEGGLHQGLGWIPGSVSRFDLPNEFAVPHVGWNDINPVKKESYFSSLSADPDFYFDHSYHFRCDDEHVLATCHYGITIVAAIQKENIFGVQFHPEKSQNNGLRLFRSFFNKLEQC